MSTVQLNKVLSYEQMGEIINECANWYVGDKFMFHLFYNDFVIEYTTKRNERNEREIQKIDSDDDVPLKKEKISPLKINKFKTIAKIDKILFRMNQNASEYIKAKKSDLYYVLTRSGPIVLTIADYLKNDDECCKILKKYLHSTMKLYDDYYELNDTIVNFETLSVNLMPQLPWKKLNISKYTTKQWAVIGKVLFTIFNTICNQEQDKFGFFISYLNQICNLKRTKIIPFMVGNEGTGKTSFINLMKRMLPGLVFMGSIDTLEEKYNLYLQTSYLIVLNETPKLKGGDDDAEFAKLIGKMKDNCDGESTNVRAMHTNMSTANSVKMICNYIIASNYPLSKKEMRGRRWLMTLVNRIMDEKECLFYMKPIETIFGHDEFEIIFNFFKNITEITESMFKTIAKAINRDDYNVPSEKMIIDVNCFLQAYPVESSDEYKRLIRKQMVNPVQKYLLTSALNIPNEWKKCDTQREQYYITEKHMLQIINAISFKKDSDVKALKYLESGLRDEIERSAYGNISYTTKGSTPKYTIQICNIQKLHDTLVKFIGKIDNEDIETIEDAKRKLEISSIPVVKMDKLLSPKNSSDSDSDEEDTNTSLMNKLDDMEKKYKIAIDKIADLENVIKSQWAIISHECKTEIKEEIVNENIIEQKIEIVEPIISDRKKKVSEHKIVNTALKRFGGCKIISTQDDE